MQYYDTLPTQRPRFSVLDTINSPADLRGLAPEQLAILCDELRAYLLYSVAKSGGHFGAGLGVIELSVALHYVFDTPEDALIWDVGHQCYPHKILTGRREQMRSIRSFGGLSPFCEPSESPYDLIKTGHAGNALGFALGLAVADDLLARERHIVSVVGDGSITCGMHFEALNHAGNLKNPPNVLLVLNDNGMSISKSVGALSKVLRKAFKTRSPKPEAKVLEEQLQHRNSIKVSNIFEQLGWQYTHLADGHDIVALTHTLNHLKTQKGLQVLHVKTTKGKGFTPAESDPIRYHAINKMAPQSSDTPAVSDVADVADVPKNKKHTYNALFSDWLIQRAREDDTLCAITPAMCEGSNLISFARQFPTRYFDVGIAEQHALTFAAALTLGGMHTVLPIYSTFLQRGLDQLIHDICLQDLSVLIPLDRAGLVGEDGATHHGIFDLSFTQSIPGLSIVTPASGVDFVAALEAGYAHTAARKGTVIVRYPRGESDCPAQQPLALQPPLAWGKAQLIRTGKQPIALLGFGTLLTHLAPIAEAHDFTLVDMRFVKPIDLAMLKDLLKTHSTFITLEDNQIIGGAGASVVQALMRLAHEAHQSIETLNLGIEDIFVTHGNVAALQHALQLDTEGLEAKIADFLKLSK